MQDYADKQRRESPEHLIGYVVQRVRNHVLWDSLLIVFPPFLAISYISLFLYRTAWLATFGLSLISLGALAAALLAAVLRYRPLVPSLPAAARLVDEKAEAMDRFVTLATLGPTPSSEPLVNRLHREATAFLGRIEIRRDFPYRIKQSFYWSVAGSILALLLFHLLMIHSTAPGVSPQKRLRELTEQMAQRPHLSELARRLRSLTIKLDDPAVSPQDKQALVQEMQQEVQEQQKEEQQKDNKDLLSDTSSTLKSLEQQSGGSEQQEQKKDGVGKQTEEGQGEGKQSSGTGGESKGDLTAQANKDLQEGKSSQGDPQGPGQEKNPGKQDQAKGNQPDASKSGQENSKETSGQPQGSPQEKLGKSKSEEIPQNGPPAERFYKPGEEGKQGIKDGRYVTVQLPEELTADGNGVGTTSKDAKESRNRPKVPVSNVPLPAHVPDAPSEKQPMPLEYRDLIR